MENSRLVLGLLHSVLGKSKPSTKGDHAFHCPFCKHHKPKLERAEAPAQRDAPVAEIAHQTVLGRAQVARVGAHHAHEMLGPHRKLARIERAQPLGADVVAALRDLVNA